LQEPHVGAPIDANGNLTADGARTFEWDAVNRLVAVNVGTHRSEFTYDGFSRRVGIVEKDGGTTTSDTRLVWCGLALCEARDSGGTVLKRYFDEGVLDAGTAFFYTRDHLGSVRELTDSTGTVRARYDYDPWGRRTKVSGDKDAHAGHTGHYHHGASGLTLALFRAYDPGLGRWLSEDPLGFGDGPNVYAYVGSNPMIRVDRFGLQYDSVTRSLMEAIRRGNVAEIRNILEVSKDVLSAEWKTAGQDAITKLQTPARDLIRATLKRSESYASELEEETFAELIENGGPKAKKMLKLIKEGGRISDKIKSCFR
jgi:RHS repeat-associated protein